MMTLGQPLPTAESPGLIALYGRSCADWARPPPGRRLTIGEPVDLFPV
ncbi:hypothetical protein [Lyngbya sp. CCY1209]|nr:hypothetical protein [Lyngbya sp. CCY1209]MEB3882837.1 hypothetical protein [Lyngbya sp. CCY1209]